VFPRRAIELVRDNVEYLYDALLDEEYLLEDENGCLARNVKAFERVITSLDRAIEAKDLTAWSDARETFQGLAKGLSFGNKDSYYILHTESVLKLFEAVQAILDH
jgi:hypothetical protein